MQTDKTTGRDPLAAGGHRLKILVEEGEVAPVGAVLVVIGDEGEQLLRAVESQGASEPRPSRSSRSSLGPGRRRAGDSGGTAARAVSSASTRRPAGHRPRRADPGVRRARRGARATAVASRSGGSAGAIVEQVTRAHREIPAVTFVEECDFTDVDVSLPGALTILRGRRPRSQFPELNARLEGDEIVLLDRVDVGVAVQTDDGLVVPVVRGCARRALEDIDARSRRLADGARAGMLAAEELRDATFTFTSAGKLGGLS